MGPAFEVVSNCCEDEDGVLSCVDGIYLYIIEIRVVVRDVEARGEGGQHIEESDPHKEFLTGDLCRLPAFKILYYSSDLNKQKL